MTRFLVKTVKTVHSFNLKFKPRSLELFLILTFFHSALCCNGRESFGYLEYVISPINQVEWRGAKFSSLSILILSSPFIGPTVDSMAPFHALIWPKVRAEGDSDKYSVYATSFLFKIALFTLTCDCPQLGVV